MTALHYAAYCGDLNELRRQLEAGADPNQKDDYRGYAAVHWLADALRQEAARTREFVAKNKPRSNSKGQELKSNITDPDSAKMTTSKGVIQGYAAQAAVDSAHQIIIAADVVGSGSEQAMLILMIEPAKPWSTENTLVTADAGYHSDANVQQLHNTNTPALIADNQMRKRDERFEGQGKHKAKPDPLSQKKASGEPEASDRK